MTGAARRGFTRNDRVMVDCSWSTFHGLAGRVLEVEERRRPLPYILVQFKGAPAGCGLVLFTDLELRHLPRPAGE
jgi:hypothetical protein